MKQGSRTVKLLFVSWKLVRMVIKNMSKHLEDYDNGDEFFKQRVSHKSPSQFSGCVNKEVNKRETFNLIYLDFSKAFETAPQRQNLYREKGLLM